MKSEARSLRMIGEPGPCAPPRKRTLVVGITGDGYMPVVEEPVVDELDVLTGVRSVIGLPSVLLAPAALGGGAASPRERALEQLRREFGYEADELVPMETNAPPGFLLAPLLRNSRWRERVGFVPGVYEVPLNRISTWLRHREVAGAIESPGLRRGLALARRFFPRWARVRLCQAIGEIEARSALAERPA